MLKCSLNNYLSGYIELKFMTAEILKFKFSLIKENNENFDPVVILENDNFKKINIKEDKEKLIIKSEKLQIKINLDPWEIAFYDSKEQLLSKSVLSDKSTWNNDLNLPFGITVDSEEQNYIKEIKSIHYTHLINYKENFYGFGEKFNNFNKRGQKLVMWNRNGQGVRSENSYKNIPFFISTNGFGFLLNNSVKSEFFMGSRSNRAFSIELKADYLEYYFIYGPTPLEIIENYTKLTGLPALPPKWSFGLWFSTYFIEADENSVRKQIDKMRELEIPCDVYHFDCHWLNDNMWNDFTWDKKAFPNPTELLEELHQKNYKISLWENPYISSLSELYEEGKVKGYFLKNEVGKTYDAQTWRADLMALTGIVDFTNPEAVKWYKDIHRKLIKQGIDVFKTDFGEDIPSDAFYYNGEAGAKMHNLYALLYNQTVFEVTKEETGNELVWARSAWSGSQRYPTHWGGDPHATWEDMASTLRGGLSFSMSGMGYWSHDIGGFKGKPDSKLFIRWAQFGLFSPHSRLHGWSTRDPWEYGEEAKGIFKKFTKLRYQLIPYIYSYAKIASEKGHPLMRPMIMEYPEDYAVYNLDQQYLFGKELLIAPVLSEDNWVQIYLPEGNWYDYWSKKIIRGGRFINKEIPLAEMPIFIKTNSMIPSVPVQEYIGNKKFDKLTINIFLDEENYENIEFNLFDEEKYFLELRQNINELTFINNGESNKDFELKIYGTHEVENVEIDGMKAEKVDYDDFNSSEKNVWCMSEQELIIVKTVKKKVVLNLK